MSRTRGQSANGREMASSCGEVISMALPHLRATIEKHGHSHRLASGLVDQPYGVSGVAREGCTDCLEGDVVTAIQESIAQEVKRPHVHAKTAERLRRVVAAADHTHIVS